MFYNIIRDNYCTFKIFEQNKLAPRSYFIPFSSEKLADKTNILDRRYKSDKVRCLNGTWDFKYYKSVKELPTNFDTENIDFDQIPVPSCWQFLGYEPPFYTNVNYQFKPNPPHIPTTKLVGTYGDDINGTEYACGKEQYNSVGVYRTFIDVESLDKKFIISFLGVASNLELYINGKYVGYSEGAHNTAEFLLDKYLVQGKNELVAVVYKWCNGSYLEDQDMFRNNGIFRDVLLYESDLTYIHDFDFFTNKTANGLYDVILSVDIENYDGAKVEAKLISPEGKVVVSKTADASAYTKIMFDKLDVIEWNAEIPTLYVLKLILKRNNKVIECIRKEVGFKTVTIDGRVLLFNGKPVKIKGVNHHDTHPQRGYVLTAKEIYLDMKICKDYNMNAVRTSHYPPDPLLLEIADQLGLYVIDEADIETHGLMPRGKISNNLKWKHHYWDRVKRLYMRDRNSPCIIMWSLGNEAGGIKCQDYCYDELKKLTLIPIYYERAIAYKRGGYDVVGGMYLDPITIVKLAENKLVGHYEAKKHKYKDKPYFLCEYVHAMGVGPGSIKEYMEAFYKYDALVGGCVWEMIDHAIYHEDKKYKYTYGGDHGEYTHDGNFCVDGMFFPDRTPHTAALAIKNAYRPLLAEFIKPGIVKFTNVNRFRNTSYLTIKGVMLIEGEPAFEVEFPSDIEPMSSKEYNINIDIHSGDIVLHLDYFDKDKIVATEELRINEALSQIQLSHGKDLTVTEKDTFILINFDNGELIFNKTLGCISSYVVGDIKYLAEKPLKQNSKGNFYTNIFRAPTDNDRNIRRVWDKLGYNETSFVVKKYSVTNSKKEALIKVEKNILNPKGKTLFKVVEVTSIESNGVVTLSTELTKVDTRNNITLPRFGRVVELKEEFNEIYYYGCGPYENYSDFKGQSRLGLYRQKVEDFMFPYIKPQESGNRTDVRYASVKNDKGQGLMFLALDKPFNLGAKKISDEALAKITHREDLVFDNINYISIDGKMSGIGSNSCGPRALKPYLLRDKKYEFAFKIIPFTAIDEDRIVY
ncbi:MAG: glycoside hydrolase family 2 TIM barrel-domain containing protein [Christensenellales bacterium]|jgi:beta-galactosidase|nr:hypothetical protein [Clostridiales bacterium]